MMNVVLGVLLIAGSIGLALLTEGLFIPVALPLAIYGLKLLGVNMQ